MNFSSNLPGILKYLTNFNRLILGPSMTYNSFQSYSLIELITWGSPVQNFGTWYLNISQFVLKFIHEIIWATFKYLIWSLVLLNFNADNFIWSLIWLKYKVKIYKQESKTLLPSSDELITENLLDDFKILYEIQVPQYGVNKIPII